MKYLGERKEMISLCRRLETLGLSYGVSGNLSWRLGNFILITPSGRDYKSLCPEDLVVLNREGVVLSGSFKPSSEWRIHVEILSQKPTINSVLHVHPPYSTGVSCTRKDIPAFHYMVAVAGGDNIRCAPYATFGTKELSDLVVQALADRKACLMANHGLITLGVDPSGALALAVEVETLAEQFVHACACGDPVILGTEEMRRVILAFKTYGSTPNDRK